MAQLAFPVPTIAPATNNNGGGGVTSSAIDALPVLSSVTFSAVQTRITSAATVPAIGGTISVTVPSVAIAAGFQLNDVVVLDQTTNGASSQRATFVVNGTPIGNTIILRYAPVTGDAAVGATFPANSELTGQTRLPNIPATAAYARVSVIASPALDAAYKTPSSPLNQIAVNLMSGEAMAYVNYAVTGNAQTDVVSQRGEHLGFTGFIELTNRADILATRLFSVTPEAIQPSFFVVYK
jgi:hypothetical protein